MRLVSVPVQLPVQPESRAARRCFSELSDLSDLEGGSGLEGLGDICARRKAVC